MVLVRDRDYFFCRYCTTFYFPSASRDGVRVLGKSSSVGCPVCQARLLSASIEETPVLFCGNCQGVLVQQSAFRPLVSALRAHSSGPAALPRPLSRQELERKLYCPACNRLMDTHPYGGPGNVIIDLCVDCGLIWLDHGEIGRIVRAPGRDRGIWV